MKNGIKTLAMWLIIGIIFIVVLSSIVENSDSKLKYSELIASINNGKVETIQIESDGKTATVTLKDEKVKKEVNIPNMESFMSYTEDYLKEGAFTLEEKSQSIFITILSLLTPFGLLIIFLFMFIGWSFVPQNLIPSELIAVLGYVIAMFYCKLKKINIYQKIDFKPILTISSFLYLAEVVSSIGILNDIASYLQIYLMIVIMLITSLVSGLFGAGPATSAMMPVIINLCSKTFVLQADWVAIAYAASICAGSSLFMWSATAGFILSKEINSANILDEENSKKINWNIIDYLKYGIQNYIIQIVVAIIIIWFVL